VQEHLGALATSLLLRILKHQVVTGQSVEYCTSSFEGREIEKLLSPAFFRGEREFYFSNVSRYPQKRDHNHMEKVYDKPIYLTGFKLIDDFKPT
jgi:hypothetical protein